MSDKPNILVITTHDSGRHFGCYGATGVKSPAIDRLADEGVRCDQMFSVCCICSPSRSALLTGQYPARNGLVGLAGGNWNWSLKDPTRHLSHRLRRAGYETIHAGMQHETSNMAELGFDELLTGGEREPAPVTGDIAGQWLRDRPKRDQPFYMQVGFFETHTTYAYGGAQPVPVSETYNPPWTQVDDDATREHIAALQGAVTQADQGVGRILDALDAAGLAENTIVLFNTDHGLELPRGKWTQYDGGLGIAFILCWPAGGISGGRVCDALLSNVDFTPTLADLIGANLVQAADDKFDGVSFADCLTENAPTEKPDVDSSVSPDSPRSHAFGAFAESGNYAVRTADYKYIRNFRGSFYKPGDDEHEHRNPVEELFDLKQDPLELRNLAYDAAHESTRATLSDCLWTHLEATGDPILQGQPVNCPAVDPIPADDRYREALAEYLVRSR